MKFKSPQILKLEYLRNKTFLKRNRSSSKKSSSTSFILLIFSVCMTCVRRHSKMYPICNIRLSLLKREGPHMWRMCSKPNYEVSAFIDELWKPCNIRILKKWKKKKMLEISSFYTCTPKTTFIWGTVPEIRSETTFFVILGHFLPFTHPSPLLLTN